MSTAITPSRARTLRRWLFRIALGLGVLVGLWAAYVVYDDWIGHSEWREACAEADRLDPGWRFEDIVGAWPILPDERNSYVRAHAAALQAPLRGQLADDKQLEDMLTIQKQDQFRYRLSPQVIAMLRERVDAAEDARSDALALADCPEGYVPPPTSPAILYNNPSPFVYLNLVRGLLYPQFRLQVDEGDFDAALGTFRAIVYAARPMTASPHLLDALIGVAIRMSVARCVEDLLAQWEPPPDVMDSLRRLMEEDSARSPLLNYFRGERATVEDTIRAYADGRLGRDDVAKRMIFSDMQTWTKWPAVDVWINRATGSDFRMVNAVAQLRYYTWMVERLKESPDGLLEHADEWAALRDQLPRGPKTTLNNLARYVTDVDTKEIGFRCATVALAAEQFRQANDRWPATLDELVPAYLTAVPRDPFSTQPLRMARRPDGIVIYSVGPDKKDHGGNLGVVQGQLRDMGIRLWDVNQRRQPPQPSGGGLP